MNYLCHNKISTVELQLQEVIPTTSVFSTDAYFMACYILATLNIQKRNVDSVTFDDMNTWM